MTTMFRRMLLRITQADRTDLLAYNFTSHKNRCENIAAVFLIRIL
jgi:hypothetical protein